MLHINLKLNKTKNIEKNISQQKCNLFLIFKQIYILDLQANDQIESF